MPALLFQEQRPQPPPFAPIIRDEVRCFHPPILRSESLTFFAQRSVTIECDERIGANYSRKTRLIGVSSADGLCDPKTDIGKNTGKYKIIDIGYLAYNPMRINIGSIGVALENKDRGVTSPDYVVFRCKDGLLPEYVFHYLRSEAGRHEINKKTKGSVRFRLYYEQLSEIPIPVPKSVDVQRDFALVCRRLETVRNSAKQSAGRAERTLDALRREAFLEALATS